MARKRAKKPARKMSKSRPAKKTARPVETAAAAIRRLDAEFMRAAAAHDGAALVAAFYDKDAVLLPPNSPAAMAPVIAAAPPPPGVGVRAAS